MPTLDHFKYKQFRPSLESPPTGHILVELDTPISPRPRAIVVGTGGIILIEDENGTVADYVVHDGQLIIFRASRIVTNHLIRGELMHTTATNIKAQW